LSDTMVLPPPLFETIEKVIEQTNIVLKTIIPGLQIKIRKIHQEKMDNGKDGIRFEFLSIKGNIELPLRSESSGVIKIISILSTLIAVYNNPNACVVIDELDAGIFEYLLGELLEVISENGQGQLFFTSHNLRILEVLPIRNLWFTTLNEEDRYLQLKGVKKLNNARDIYLRAVQLGGQDEPIYGETDLYDIKKSFRKAGRINGEE
jgi:AAA15 family ATPase/GTPase